MINIIATVVFPLWSISFLPQVKDSFKTTEGLNLTTFLLLEFCYLFAVFYFWTSKDYPAMSGDSIGLILNTIILYNIWKKK